MVYFSAILAHFDLFGVDVAKLNINGRTEFTTPFGGVVSLILRFLIAWFLVLSAKKIIGKEEAALVEVSQALNLADPQSQVINAREHHFKVGISAYYTNVTKICDDEGLRCDYDISKASMDLENFYYRPIASQRIFKDGLKI
jgi:hypothetical protein